MKHLQAGGYIIVTLRKNNRSNVSGTDSSANEGRTDHEWF